MTRSRPLRSASAPEAVDDVEEAEQCDRDRLVTANQRG